MIGAHYKAKLPVSYHSNSFRELHTVWGMRSESFPPFPVFSTV